MCGQTLISGTVPCERKWSVPGKGRIHLGPVPCEHTCSLRVMFMPNGKHEICIYVSCKNELYIDENSANYGISWNLMEMQTTCAQFNCENDKSDWQMQDKHAHIHGHFCCLPQM